MSRSNERFFSEKALHRAGLRPGRIENEGQLLALRERGGRWRPVLIDLSRGQAIIHSEGRRWQGPIPTKGQLRDLMRHFDAQSALKASALPKETAPADDRPAGDWPTDDWHEGVHLQPRDPGLSLLTVRGDTPLRWSRTTDGDLLLSQRSGARPWASLEDSGHAAELRIFLQGRHVMRAWYSRDGREADLLIGDRYRINGPALDHVELEDHSDSAPAEDQTPLPE